MNKILMGILLTFLFACQTQTDKTNDNSLAKEDTVIEISDGHNAQNSLDWNGIYTGVLPCADCEGIETTIILKSDNSYLKTEKYLGKSEVFEEEGNFSWMSDGVRIQIQSENNRYYYKVLENAIQALDIEGNVISSELSDKYILKKN